MWSRLSRCAALACFGVGCDAWESNIGSGTEGDTEATETDGGSGTGQTSTSSTSAGGTSGSSGGATSSTTSTTTDGMPTSSDGSDSNATSDATDDSGPDPIGPGCSVQVVTAGALFDPVTRGGAGEFPAPVADELEDYCGCHTLMSGNQNIEWSTLPAPGGTLFLQYSDLSRPFSGGTLGAAMQAEVVGYAMPPGSCSYPPDPAAVLANWFDQGMPDGANYVP